MSTKAPTLPTIKHLYAHSGNCCAYPECLKELSIIDKLVLNNLSEVCHIEASKPGGQRFNPTMMDAERHGFDNLIVLCLDHHKLIDNPENSALYTVDTLKQWKKQHEKYIKDKIHKNTPLPKKALSLSKVVNLICENIDLSMPEDNSINTPEVSDKIIFNDIKKYEDIIKDNAIFSSQLNTIYTALEDIGSNKKIAILNHIKDLYSFERPKYNSLKEIKNNSDGIIESIENELYILIRDSKNINESLEYEEIIAGIRIVLVDAFIRCKILENPNAQLKENYSKSNQYILQL